MYKSAMSSKTFNGLVLCVAILFLSLIYSYTNFKSFSSPAPNISTSNLSEDIQWDKESEHIEDELSPTNRLNGREGSTKYILVFAYMHTGSTYIGNLLRQHNGSFYHFEPLRMLKQIAGRKSRSKTITFLNGTSVVLSEDKYHFASRNLIHNLFQCKFENIDVSSLTTRYSVNNLPQYDDLGDFFNCTYARTKPSELARYRFGTFKEFADLKNAARHVRPCLTNLTTQCQSSDIRTAKVIRMSKETAELILKDEPNIRIIHLFRDPRAMLDSNLRRHEMYVDNPSVFSQRTTEMCETMLSDFQAMETLKSKYPERILTVRYEEMASLPLETAKLINKFVGLPFNDRVENFVLKESVESSKNSTYLSSKWRTHIKQPQLNVVEEKCETLFKTMGYLPLHTLNNVRNLSIDDHISYNNSQYIKLS